MSRPVIVSDECVCCGACVDACPCDVLELGDESVQVIHEEACIGCACCMDTCPVGAITEISEAS